MTPGFYTAAQLSNEAYHSGPGVSNSGLKLIGDETPRHFRARYIERRGAAPRRPMFVGTALHAATLEPEAFDAGYVVAPFGARNEAGFKAWSRQQSKLILMESEHEKVLGMRAALHEHLTAAALLADVFECEYSAYAIDPETGVLVRIRIDLMTKGGWLFDLKKTQSAARAAVADTIANFGYFHQAAFYLDVFKWACGEEPAGFAFGFVEEEYPHCVSTYRLDWQDLQRGRELYRKNLNMYADCLARDRWPAHSDPSDIIELPQWKRNQIDRLIVGL